VEQDYAKALYWLRLAAEQGLDHARVRILRIEHYLHCLELAKTGDATGQYQLALCYHHGRGVKNDKEMALKWYKASAQQGNWQAGDGWRQLTSEIREFNIIMEEAQQGDNDSQYRLRYLYHKGIGVNTDHEEGEKWLQKAAENGHAKAQYVWGYEYYYGYSILQDYQQALYWFRLAAQQNQMDALYMLGECYLYGNGVARDKQQAEVWFRKAAQQGHKAALSYMMES
jgi:hypothetical protein